MRTTTLTLLFLLLLPCTGFAQANSSADFKKFGIGIGYSFRSFMNDSIRPVELSLRYRVNENHTFRIYAPIRLNRYKQQATEYSYIDAPFKDGKSTKHLFGVGLMYDYAFHWKSDFYWIMGVGGDFQWMKSRNFRNFAVTNVNEQLNRISEWKIDHNAYNFYPLVGIRYAYDKFGIEAYYKLQFSMMKVTESGFYNDYDLETDDRWRGGSYDVPLRSNLLTQPSIHFALFYLF